MLKNNLRLLVMALSAGFEPATNGLTVHCSTTELREKVKNSKIFLMQCVGFEPTRANTEDLKSSPLDHSGNTASYKS